MIPKKPFFFFHVYSVVLFLSVAALFCGPKRMCRLADTRALRRRNRLEEPLRRRLESYVRFSVSHRPFLTHRNHCLLRSLTLYSFLKTAQPGLRVAFGFKNEGGWSGHCWLENDGVPVEGAAGSNSGYPSMLVFG